MNANKIANDCNYFLFKFFFFKDLLNVCEFDCSGTAPFPFKLDTEASVIC